MIWVSSGQITWPYHSSFAVAVLVLFTPFADDVLDFAIGPVILVKLSGQLGKSLPRSLVTMVYLVDLPGDLDKQWANHWANHYIWAASQ